MTGKPLIYIAVLSHTTNHYIFNYTIGLTSPELGIMLKRMKLITRSTDTGYLHTLKGLLEANGIPATINGENTAKMITPFLMTQPGIWVYLDGQHIEALNLINNIEHTVTNKVDVKEFYEPNKNITADTSTMNAAYNKPGIAVFSWLLGAFILLNILTRLST